MVKPVSNTKIITGWILLCCMVYGVYSMFVDVVIPFFKYLWDLMQGVSKERLEVIALIILISLAISIILTGKKPSG
jgi:hypothetical protein